MQISQKVEGAYYLQASKTLSQQIMAKSERLALVIAEKQKIAQDLSISIIKLDNEIEFRSKELGDLQSRLQQFERIEAEVCKLEERERQVESQYEDYYQLNAKLEKEVKLVHQESQIVKGKAIIDYNKITETREEAALQTRQKQILEKHHDQLKKGAQNLKKKIQHAKQQQQKKKISSRHRIEQYDIQRQINSLRLEIQERREQLADQQRNKDKFLTEERYKELTKEIQRLKKENTTFETNQRLNQKLIEERRVLEDRIKFLKSVDIEFINEKKLLLSQLKEKHALFEAQMSSSLLNLQSKQTELAELEAAHPEGLSSIKRMGRKKRQSKFKSSKKIKEVQQESIPIQNQEKTSRFKGHKLKRLFFITSGVLLTLGLVLNHTICYFI